LNVIYFLRQRYTIDAAFQKKADGSGKKLLKEEERRRKKNG